MIKNETLEIDGKQYIRTYSDAGRYVVGGEPYSEYQEAIDPADANRIYVEGELMPPDESALTDKAEAYDILMGGASE